MLDIFNESTYWIYSRDFYNVSDHVDTRGKDMIFYIFMM